MSGALTGLAALGSLGLEGLNASGLMPALIRTTRSLGKIIPDVTIEEQHNDRMQVTQHPVANGSPVSDHAFMMPAEVTMRLGWTNANPVGAGVQGFMTGGLLGAATGVLSSLTEQRVKQVYQSLRDLQYNPKAAPDQMVVPFKLTTGKRLYDNMVITELTVRTDHTTEYSLILECHMQQVLLVDVQKTTMPAQAAQSDQADPSKTDGTTETTDKATKPKGDPDDAALKFWKWL